MGYFWKNKHQEISYKWKGFLALLKFRPSWKNPETDMYERTNLANNYIVSDSVPVKFPAEFSGGTINTSISQTVWDGSVHGGKPVQAVDPNKTRRFRINNEYTRELIVDGESKGEIGAGEHFYVDVPEPVRLKEDGWAVEGYPNVGNGGDRHWYGIEPDGTTHEMIWITTSEQYKASGLGAFAPPEPNTAAKYCKYSPDGTMLTGLRSGDLEIGVVKGNLSWLSIAWNAGDEPHLLGASFNELALHGHNGARSDGSMEEWEHPAYGRHYRISEKLFNDLRVDAKTDDEYNFYLSLRVYGFIPYDRGGTYDPQKGPMEGRFGIVAGSQHVGTGLEALEIPIDELELVTATVYID